MLEADRFYIPQRFLCVHDSIHWETIPLLRSHRAGLNIVQSPGHMCANGNIIWISSYNSVTVTTEAAH